MNKMVINRVRIGKVLIVSVSGEIHAEEAQALRDFLKSSYAQNFNLFLIDLLEVDFICSAGLRAILELKRETMSRNGEVRLVRPNSQVYEVFQTTGLDKILDFYLMASDALLDWISPEEKPAEKPKES
ncbi:MAG TPA: STAS domain-containing protein [Candidatus Sumerlaeota bacterium]|nr:MAG: Anti-sigma-B factor antagonist [candidate division BRC1 bacterium ADurb.Bin183]HOE62543.1 STAS domain-containing protein [Candidatus Sumerlaeota bacterium]HRR31821.1 STAS domain-containing protein [Candidatus Sumerlaeia bacterium]HON49303.1 STAS domain-containing protein [Candidatus Sumerlaeota bacterium]HOR64949.1 STAS domain-containing protein [Candidatus Sumerlaeota bacterium]